MRRRSDVRSNLPLPVGPNTSLMTFATPRGRHASGSSTRSELTVPSNDDVPQERLPSFLIIGVRKCGTTWIDQCLRLNPAFSLPKTTKEVSFFDRRHDRGLTWYSAHFQDAASDAICGECSPTYWSDPEVPNRIYKTLPDVKLIAVLRDPVERAWSAYLHVWREGRIPNRMQFWDAAEVFPDILQDGLYDAHLKRWRAYFPDSQLLLLLAEDVWSQPEESLNYITTWLGAPSASSVLPPSGRSRTEVPRSHLLSKVAHKVVMSLRDHDLHLAVNVGKRMGLQQMLFRQPPATRRDWLVMTRELRRNLQEYYSDSLKLISDTAGRDLREYWWTY